MKDVRIEILEKIKEYDSIVIGRHFRPHGPGSYHIPDLS